MERRRPFCKLFPEESMWRRLRGACAAGNPPFRPSNPSSSDQFQLRCLPLYFSLTLCLFFVLPSLSVSFFSRLPFFIFRSFLLPFPRNRFPRLPVPYGPCTFRARPPSRLFQLARESIKRCERVVYRIRQRFMLRYAYGKFTEIQRYARCQTREKSFERYRGWFLIREESKLRTIAGESIVESSL